MNKNLRNRKRLSILPALLWLLVQLSMTGLFAPASSYAETSNPLFSGTLIICTPTGIKYVSAAEFYDESGGTDQQPSNTAENCEWCMSFGNMPPLAAIQASVNHPIVPLAGLIGWPPFQAHFLETQVTPFYGRGPPSLNKLS